MDNTLLIIIISITVISYSISLWLDFLNSKNRNKKVPEELANLYDSEKYSKSQDYGKTNDKFSFISSSFSTLLIIIMLAFSGFALVNHYALSISHNEIVSALIFLGILVFASDLLDIPFSLYSTFVIEERFGFNKTNIKTFILDKIKSWGLIIVIGGSLFSVFIWFYLETREMFWIYAWITLSVFSVFMTMFYSTLIVPLFNKQSPLEAGELRDAISEMGEKADFKIDNIFVIDGSKRSTKANAYFSGLGPKKRIVLYDTLINDLTTNEIIAVLAHEIGHYKNKHTLSNMILSFIQSGIMLFIFSLLVDNPALSKALGSEVVSFQLGLIAFGILYSPVSMILSIFMNMYSRKNEFEADKFANDLNYGDYLISGLKKLTAKNLSNLTPHPLYVFFYFSHPSLLQRIKAINNGRNRT